MIPSAEEAFQRALADLQLGREEEALAPLETAVSHYPRDARLRQVLGLLHRAAHDLEPAVAAFETAAELAPTDAKIAHGVAQCRFEAGLPSVEWFERLRTLAPDDLSALQGWVAAIAAEQGTAAAVRALEPELRARPAWTDGHLLMSRLLSAAGKRDRSCEVLAKAARRHPHERGLWNLWLRLLIKQAAYEEALAVVAEARRHGSDRALDVLEAAALSESGRIGEASAAWQRIGALTDIESMIYEARHLLRVGRADVIAARAAQVRSPQNLDPLFPYFALAWRITGDPKLRWLEHQEGLVRIHDLSAELPELPRLAALLRRLHTQADQPLEQSVRLGTQTDGPLLNRIDPEIAALRQVLMKAVRTHLDQLPPIDPSHPQLRYRRDRPVRFAGSWSVRLRDAGHHEQHVHPQGWFSSALYIGLPESMGGNVKAGWLTLGQPQDSLGLNLEPLSMVEPRPGRLVLFPSTMWHGTVPFEHGERLTVAFDVARPI